jgi:DnaK suppressor protein
MNAKTENRSGLTPRQVATLEERLQAERRKLASRLAARREALATPFLREPDDGDWATGTADQALLTRLLDRDGKLIHEIDRALGRVADGSYGTCELSGEPIGYERLLARPWARQAVAVRESVERRQVARGQEGGVLEGAEDDDFNPSSDAA